MNRPSAKESTNFPLHIQAFIEKSKSLWPGFSVRCNHCGRYTVYLQDDLRFGEEGPFGDIRLVCAQCGHQAVIAASY